MLLFQLTYENNYCNKILIRILMKNYMTEIIKNKWAKILV